MTTQVITVLTWEDLQNEIEKLRNDLSTRADRNGLKTTQSDLLFRGHADSNWPLFTTIERKLDGEVSVREYLSSISCATQRLPAQYSIKFDLNSCQINSVYDFNKTENLGWIQLMAYLRHHGFPSPLLDWTTSLEVAGYFAFRESRKTKSVSIYAFMEWVSGSKSALASRPHIHGIGNTIEVHQRHREQLSQYTLCVRKRGEDLCFSSHEMAFINIQKIGVNQDYLVKFELPSTEGPRVLKILRDKGITTCKLFGESEDSLCFDIGLELFS